MGIYVSERPEVDFLRWDRELEARLARRPRCCRCGRHLQDDGFDIHGRLYCRDCLERLFRVRLEDLS